MARREAEGSVDGRRRKTEAARALRRETTPAEDRLWRALRASELGCRVRRQHVICGWIVDFYIASARLVIELDGDVHEHQREDDERRMLALREAGLRVIRFRNEAVLHSLPSVVAGISDEIHRDAPE